MKCGSSFVIGAAVAALAMVVTPGRARAADPEAALATFGRPRSLIIGVTGATARVQEVVSLAETTRSVSTAFTVSSVRAHGWSLGAGLLLGYGRMASSSGNVTTTTIGAEARIGRLTALAPLVSWWPQLGLGYERADTVSTDPNLTLVGGIRGSVMIDLDVPVLLHPAEHFFVAAGPGLQARLMSDDQSVALIGRVSFGWCL
jgi:hypothetical protein